MKIIRLGNINVTFCCEHCHTIWEINTQEFNKDKNGNYFTICPLCDTEIIIKNDNELVEFLNKRIKLSKENDNE